jgi:hypothetical protein
MTNKYFIFYVKNEYLKLVERYPSFLKMIFNESVNSFFSKQNEEVFEPMVIRKKYLIDYLDNRLDFIYDNKVYYIMNKITDETITVKINEFSLEVTESEDKYIIYDVLKEYSKNFYMIVS